MFPGSLGYCQFKKCESWKETKGCPIIMSLCHRHGMFLVQNGFPFCLSQSSRTGHLFHETHFPFTTNVLLILNSLSPFHPLLLCTESCHITIPNFPLCNPEKSYMPSNFFLSQWKQQLTWIRQTGYTRMISKLVQRPYRQVEVDWLQYTYVLINNMKLDHLIFILIINNPKWNFFFWLRWCLIG